MVTTNNKLFALTGARLLSLLQHHTAMHAIPSSGLPNRIRLFFSIKGEGRLHWMGCSPWSLHLCHSFNSQKGLVSPPHYASVSDSTDTPPSKPTLGRQVEAWRTLESTIYFTCCGTLSVHHSYLGQELISSWLLYLFLFRYDCFDCYYSNISSQSPSHHRLIFLLHIIHYSFQLLLLVIKLGFDFSQTLTQKLGKVVSFWLEIYVC